MISDLIRAVQKELGLQPLGKNGGWSQEAQDVFVNKLKTERKKRKRMKVEERLLDDASVDSAQRKHGELSAEVQALADENQEIRELKARVDDLILDCQRYEEENEDLKRTIVVLRSKLAVAKESANDSSDS